MSATPRTAAATEDPEEPATTTPDPAWAAPLWVITGVLGAVLALAPTTIAAAADRLLPLAMTSGGRGTNYPNMEVALPEGLRLTGLVLMATAVLTRLATPQLASTLFARTGRRTTLVVGAALAAIGFATYLWYASPPNMFPANARIHWVDIWFDRRDDWFYPLIKVHRFFYDVPHLFQAGLGALNTVLLYLIGRVLFDRRWVAALVALSFLGSAFMLLFAGTAEDVHLALATLLLAFFAHLERRPILWGVAVAMAYLARPPFVLLPLAVVIVEGIADLLDGRPTGLRIAVSGVLRNRFLVVGSVVGGALIFLWNLGLIVAGVSWITGDSVSSESLSSAMPQPVDGFTLTRMSGAFVLHLLWIGGPIVIAANVVTAAGLRTLPAPVARAIASGWLFTLLTLLTLEAQPIYDFSYVNVRYLSYVWPHLLIGGWAALLVPTVRTRHTLLLGLAFLLTAAPAAAYRADLRLRDQVVDNPYSDLFAHRRELREAAGDGPVAIGSGDKWVRNYLAYLLKRPVQDVSIDPDEVPDEGLIVTLRDEEIPGEIVIDTGEVVVLRPG